MSQPQDSDPLSEDLDQARALLDRTVRFLAHCMEDPEAAMRSEDPRALIQGLQGLAAEPAEAEASETPHKEGRTIQLRPRRTA
jgi:hypothetical protein